MTTLYVIQGNDQGCHFELSTSMKTTIGRDPQNDIHLRDAEVSRHHAHIDFIDGKYRVIDDRSVNGVIVNGKRAKNRLLTSGDQILLGQTLLLFANRPPNGHHLEAPHPENLPLAEESLDDREPSEQVIVQTVPSSSGRSLLHSRLFSGSGNWNPQTDAHLDAHLKMMYHTTLVTSQTLDINVLLHRILDLIFEWVKIDRGSIMLYDPESHQLIPQATRLEGSRESDDPDRSKRLSVNKSIVGYVLKRREGVLTNDAQKDGRWVAPERSIREVICVPMLGRYGLVGIIYIDTLGHADPLSNDTASGLLTPMPRLTADHLRLMVAIAHQAALAVEDTRYYKGMIQGERLAAVGQTITTFSHHIKNILQGISGGSHLIQMGLDRHDEDLIRQGWGIVEKNQSRISRLILDMLTFSKEREPAFALGDIRETVREIVELMQAPAGEQNVRIENRSDELIPKFFFDVEQIHRAVTNIVTNGIDAAGAKHREAEEKKDIDWEMDTLFSKQVTTQDEKERGIVQIDVKLDQKRSIVSILVDDNGHGIPPGRRASLFRPFYSEKKGRGTGLGLLVAHKVIQEHDGTIRVQDSPLGGARFVVELPLRLTLD